MPALTASNATLAGSAPSAPRTVGTPTRLPQVSSWSAAAARKVSAAPSSTSLSSATSTRASLPTVVVLPVPFTPTTITTAGYSLRSVCRLRSSVGSTSLISSARRMALAFAGSAMPSTRSLVRSAVDQLGGRRHAEIGGDQDLLELVPGVLVDPVPADQHQQPAAQRRCSEPASRRRSRASRLSGASGPLDGRRLRLDQLRFGDAPATARSLGDVDGGSGRLSPASWAGWRADRQRPARSGSRASAAPSSAERRRRTARKPTKKNASRMTTPAINQRVV